jgi:GDP-L-fucose synthase
MDFLNKKIYIAGHRGMVGSAIFRSLKKQGYQNIIYRTRQELDLINQNNVNNFFKSERPEQVYLAAARVGGIYANNNYPAEFLYENLTVQNNIIHAAWKSGVKKLLFLGSSCIYPKEAIQPMSEGSLLSGKLEPTNEPYAIAKIAGIKLCESYNRQYGVDYRSVMPTNLFGPGDNYHLKNSHVIPALIRRFHEAKEFNLESVKIWGSGKPKREFLYVDDLAEACIFIMNLDLSTYMSHVRDMQNHVNVGSGFDISIKELAELIKKITAYKGNIEFDNSMPDGAQKKLMDSSLINLLGWKAKYNFEDALIKSYRDFIEHKTELRN